MTWQQLFDKYYRGQDDLRQLVATHSQCVADFAVECVQKHGIDADIEFIRQAAMLHDIGVVKCHAPKILCVGDEPYIRHGLLGAGMLRNNGMPRHARVCERHTGAGLTVNDIVSQNLPLPHRDFLPETIEEKAICFADKFYSKSGDITVRKDPQKVLDSMARFGKDSLNRYLAMAKIFL